MRSFCLLLGVAIIQGVIGQDDIFSVVPKASNIVPAGEQVVLECVTREPGTCAWKLDVPELEGTGFLTQTAANFLTASGLRARDATSQTDCTIIIDSVERRHSGHYTCSPFMNGGQKDAPSAEVVVAVKPASVAFIGEQAETTELTVSSVDTVSVSCEARDSRPSAELHWFLEGSELTDGVVSEETEDPETRLVTTRSTLTHLFERQDEGATLICRASHPAYEEEDNREASLGVVVEFAPVRAEGSDLGTLYGFTDGEDKDLTINFTANPRPSTIQWSVGNDAYLTAGKQTFDGRIIAGPLEEVDPAMHEYSLRLTFSPVAAEDHNTTFTLRLENNLGEQELRVRVAADAPPPPAINEPQPASEGNEESAAAVEGDADSEDSVDNAGVSGGAIGGIIVAVIVLLAVIALVAFARSRGKWCFAAKSSDAGAEADTESAHDEKTDKPEGKGFKLSNLYSSLVTKKKEGDVESAANKEETKELTAPDGEGSPKREKGEVVYAELVLNKDGVKTEVRPSPEKTEYATIVGTKTPEAKE
ncbi:fasciclin-3-like isoform X2 [Amphibalanus amphitrite]|uniref:fasciclin-3-like isoform X2 n=1 Tax=Amphibalanus amphitrite TaxID=1232801 RepID=UPI001C8FF287|nr:fasciclin-3-like isoform X2 [Amphibalanus amphitrite]